MEGFTQYFASLTSTVGNAVNNANTQATAQSQLVAQAQSLQQQVSGVSLDEEATPFGAAPELLRRSQQSGHRDRRHVAVAHEHDSHSAKE